ncbi:MULTISPECIES: ABC transporter permease [Paenibacillus]|uniref:Protein lplB n=2 Tax=Paenibacillus TaxID=44249 RepID=A0A081NUG9_9BACL|nr:MULTISPECIES: ABC transporter permease subunit [Paenibacillus]KEQ22092.1 protein lplB [Paenibacillus tyrfis]KZE77722.1 protein lplB [Paenibacillus elgii]MBU7320250.1 ABC transporter permease subunit [Paenibacillus oleatilyticus]MCM3272745.1 ABC transporter permease subunit [Paenibacillus elgii]NEN81396.1 sugar ABC transporter permease [Paenibacillus elgii]
MRTFRKEYPLHIMLIPGVILTLIYSYGPMAGLVMAFQNFEPLSGFFKSEWVGWDNFTYVFHLPDFKQVFWNTILISIFKIALFLLVPLILALLLNEVTKRWFSRLVQSTIFLPFFLSWTVLGGIVIEIFSLNGPVNSLLSFLGLKEIMFMLDNGWFRGIIIGSDVWKSMGYNMIVMLAAITGINGTLYEAAEVDGAGRWKQMLHITLPGMLPMLILLGVLSLGNILNAGFEQILIMYNPTVYEGADIIDTFVYRLGLFSQQFGPAAAVGLFKSVISLGLVSIAYYAAYKYNNYRIF